MKTSKTKSSFIIILLFLFIPAQSQNSKILEFIKSLPNLEFGKLPYWHGKINDYNSFEHGFNYRDTINSIYNDLIHSSFKNSQKCFFVKNKVIQACNYEELYFNNKNGCTKTLFRSNGTDLIKEMFCPSLFAVAKSLIYNKFYVVYFWKASFTESIQYYALIYDLNGNLTSYLDLDYWHVGFPYFPFSSQTNKIRKIDYAKRLAAFLPNNLILVREPFTNEGGGDYYIYKINDNGFFEQCRFWTETGEIKKSLTSNDKYVNMIRVDEDGKQKLSLICFAVQDQDGYSNIRLKENSSSEIIRKIRNGDVVFGTYTQNGWVKISFSAQSNGIIDEGGYIHNSRLKKLSDDRSEFIALPSESEWNTGLKTEN